MNKKRIVGIVIGFLLLNGCLWGMYFYPQLSAFLIRQQSPTIKITAIEFAERLKVDSSFWKLYQDSYIEVEGVLLGYTTIPSSHTAVNFTAGKQTDTSYLVGQTLKWKQIETNGALDACDSLILLVGRTYNLETLKPTIYFTSDIANAAGETVMNHASYKECKTAGHLGNYNYSLENFCINTVLVKAKLKNVKIDSTGAKVYLSNGIVMAKGKIDKKKFD